MAGLVPAISWLFGKPVATAKRILFGVPYDTAAAHAPSSHCYGDAAGEDVETALERALEERLSRVTTAGLVDRQAALRKFFDRVSRMPVKDDRSIDETIEYGRR
jgi:antitoxin VapB